MEKPIVREARRVDVWPGGRMTLPPAPPPPAANTTLGLAMEVDNKEDWPTRPGRENREVPSRRSTAGRRQTISTLTLTNALGVAYCVAHTHASTSNVKCPCQACCDVAIHLNQQVVPFTVSY